MAIGATLALLRTGRWFAGLPDALAQALIGMARARTLAAGEVLFLRGDAPCGLYAVLRGGVRISGTGGTAEQARSSLLIRLEGPSSFRVETNINNGGDEPGPVGMWTGRGASCPHVHGAQ